MYYEKKRGGQKKRVPKTKELEFTFFHFCCNLNLKTSTSSLFHPSLFQKRLLRHGRSKPNEAGLIVSSLENGIKREHGLSATGREQAKEAG